MYLRILFIIIIIANWRCIVKLDLSQPQRNYKIWRVSKSLHFHYPYQREGFTNTKRMSINLSIDWLPEKINSPIDDKEARGSTRLEEKQHHRTELTNGSNFFYRMLCIIDIFFDIVRINIFVISCTNTKTIFI